MKKIFVGGQALPDGVMMRSKRFVSKARRLPNGSITTTLEKIKPNGNRHPLLLLPFIRGCAGLFEIIWTLFKGLSKRALVLISIGMAAGSWAANLLYKLLFPMFSLALGGSWGITQSLAVISGYVVLMAAMLLSQYVRRLLRYHGAEHQCVYAAEEGCPLTPESAGRFPLDHPRCGTNLFAMYLISSSLTTPMLPVMSVPSTVVAVLVLSLSLFGLWYEVIALTKSNKWWGLLARLTLTPGMWFQRLTVRRPDFDELEVACAAVKAVVEAEEKEDASA